MMYRRRRTGYSAFRKNKRHQCNDIARLYKYANDSNSPHMRMAREKLHRWGFNYQRQCCLGEECDKLLVRLPGLHEVFPCVDYRDRMHGLVIFLHRMITTLLDELITNRAHRRTLDRRLSEVGKRHFRVDGKPVKVQRSIFTDVGMTAADKSVLIFQLPHVIGVAGDDIISARLHIPLATAISQAQLMLIAISGRRCYSKAELDVIFNKGFVLFFGALESVRAELYRVRVTAWAASDDGPAPKRHKRQSRYITPCLTMISISCLTMISISCITMIVISCLTVVCPPTFQSYQESTYTNDRHRRYRRRRRGGRHGVLLTFFVLFDSPTLGRPSDFCGRIQCTLHTRT